MEIEIRFGSLLANLVRLTGAFLTLFWTGPIYGETVNYTYDAQGRISQASTTGSGDNSGLIISYQYDPANNRLLLIVTGSKNRGQQVVVVPLNGFTVIPLNP